MQWPALAGDEEVVLTNLSKEGTLFFRLPARALEAELDRGRGIERKPMRLDTLIIEPEERRVSLVWRAHFPLGSFDEMGEYPHLAAWVLDLDVADKRRRDWEEAQARARAEGTAVLDLEAHPLEQEDYYEALARDRQAESGPARDTSSLDLEKMGTYKRVVDDSWLEDASDGKAGDAAARAKQEAADQAWLDQKNQALKALEEKDARDAARRQEIGEAIAKNKPVPPPGGGTGSKK
jgi:hypothetical protein